MLTFQSYTISMQEVPGEVSLVLQMAGCRHRCMGCHSQELWNEDGHTLTDHLEVLLAIYMEMITCVCFMGEGTDLEAMADTLRHIKETTGLKTCLYTGFNRVIDVEVMLPWLDFLKTGEYIRKLGGLESSATNQRFYRIHPATRSLDDLTHLFYERKRNP